MRYNGKYEEIISQLVKARGELYLLLYVALFFYDWFVKMDNIILNLITHIALLV